MTSFLVILLYCFSKFLKKSWNVTKLPHLLGYKTADDLYRGGGSMELSIFQEYGSIHAAATVDFMV